MSDAQDQTDLLSEALIQSNTKKSPARKRKPSAPLHTEGSQPPSESVAGREVVSLVSRLIAMGVHAESVRVTNYEVFVSGLTYVDPSPVPEQKPRAWYDTGQ